MSERRWLAVSPCRNEERFLRRSIDSVLAQTAPPDRWVIVDDGSSDSTPRILSEYAARHDFIHVHRREDRGSRAVGPGVIDAFYAGLELADSSEFDYICKLDLDLDLPPGYFATLIDRMEAEPRIGTCSGKAYYEGPSGELISEACGDEMSVGMTKFYRRECFEDIGGFVRQVMWDGIDCHRCRMRGWRAVSWDEESLRFVHLRPMGSSQGSWWQGRMRHGFGQWFMGTGPTYMAASALFRMTRPPYVWGGLAMMWGYLRSALRREARYDDPEFRSFLRRYQWNCLRYGKSAATMRIDREDQSPRTPPARGVRR